MFLMVPDESEFSHRVPLVIGTCTMGRIINIIWDGTAAFLSEEYSGLHSRECGGSLIRRHQQVTPGSGCG